MFALKFYVLQESQVCPTFVGTKIDMISMIRFNKIEGDNNMLVNVETFALSIYFARK